MTGRARSAARAPVVHTEGRIIVKGVRTIVPLLAASLSAAPLSAQVAVGFTAGQTSSTVSAGRLGIFEQAALSGHTVGLTAALDINRHFGVTVGLAHTRKGTRYALPGWVVGPSYWSDGTLNYERDYIEISVLARAMLPLWEGRASLYALAGPALDVSGGCDVVFHEIMGPTLGPFPRCLLPDYRGAIHLAEQYDLGAMGGIGGSVAIPWRMRLSAEILYTIGLKSDGMNGEDVRNRTRTIQFGVSYALWQGP
ncbi:MAG: porin family protein [Gemmatimonadetes bacterium]|nr:porin family protein [Gemmatimonadota bacterium]MYB99685.1 porin family protein [Gemmatimonadota bacterium]MYI47266.1 porin family protein [Gemmatimonadota bacterium]